MKTEQMGLATKTLSITLSVKDYKLAMAAAQQTMETFPEWIAGPVKMALNPLNDGMVSDTSILLNAVISRHG